MYLYLFSAAPLFLFPLLCAKQTKDNKNKDSAKSVPNLSEKPTTTTTPAAPTAKTSSRSAEEPSARKKQQKSDGLRTAHQEDSFDKLQPREMFVNRYNEIASAPKVSRQDAEYDTLKMVANDDDDFAKEMTSSH